MNGFHEQRRCRKTIAGVVLIVLGGCGPANTNSKNQISNLDTTLRGIAQQLASDPSACVDYLDLCERAESLCVMVPATSDTATVCSGIKSSCDTNLAKYCSGLSQDAGTDAQPDAGAASEACTPTTCAAAGKNCGSISDGCGATLDCGSCTAPQTCGGAGTQNVCGAPQASCLTADGSWSHSQSFAVQTGTFTASFDATPSQNDMDGVLGLSQSPAGAYTDLAAIVRFNTSGTIDARNGGSYSAATPITYKAGSTYHFRLAVDIAKHTYSAYVTPPGGSEVAIGTSFAFRTEQASLTALADFNAYAKTGSETACSFSVQGSSCAPKTCADLGYNCGQANDGCGGMLNCGTCTSPETCGGGGTSNVCGQSTCVPKTCSDFPAGACGQQPDGCGGLTANCGTCSTSGVIASSRKADWAKAGVQGGIPSRAAICATFSPGASTSQINQAIASCSSGGVVYLNAGTYNLSGGILLNKSNVTLRGAGPDKTFLVFSGSGGGTCDQPASICVGAGLSQSHPQNLTNWTAGYSQRSTQVTLSSVNNLKVGGMIVFDQLNDSTDTGNVFVGTAYSTEGSGNVVRSGRAQTQVSMVTAISGNTVTISPGIYMPNWRASQSPQAYWPSNTVTGVGVESLSIDNTNSSAEAAVTFNGAANSWETNVRSLNVNRDHVWLWYSTHVAVVSNYFYGTQRGAWSEYGVEPDADSASVVANNIFQHIVTPITIGQASGDVYAYNYSIDDWATQGTSWMQAGLFPHDEGTSMDLFEGNQMPGLQADNTHGSKNFLTFFRNRLLGWDEVWGSPKSGYSNTIPVNIEAYNRYFNLIGNVLGEPGYHTNYQDVATTGSNAARSIFVLGWTGEMGGGSGDPLTPGTLMRWGNYDVATGAAHWNASEVPSGLSLYANPIPGDHNLPASFFLSGQPSWWGTPWGTPPWPAIGPDVTGGTGPAGHSYDIPAKLCYDHTLKDSSGILKFNAAGCYGP